MLASIKGHDQVVESLLKVNADVNIQGMKGVTALILACMVGHDELHMLVKATIQDNSDEGTALMRASHDQVVELLLKANADVNVQANNGTTALMLASDNGHDQVVELLLKANADVNVQANNGTTALMLASDNGHDQVVELLLGANADVNVQDKNNRGTALMRASLNGHDQVVELLLKANADVNIQDNNGHTALMRASKNGHDQVVQYSRY
jgi:serine/threonine-protein phosphatase 6 regulatory ankyrin repeat subunit B